MIRGLVRVVPRDEVKPGRFYLAPTYDGRHFLFQCIQTDEPADDGFRLRALFLKHGTEPSLVWGDVPDQHPVVELGDVHVRVDPNSITGSAATLSPRPEMFIIDGDVPLLLAPTGLRGWVAVDLSNGRTPAQTLGHQWLSFSRWSLVIDDEAGEERTIFSRDRQTP